MRLRIYVVEDNAAIRENLVECLEEMSEARVVGFAETQNAAAAWLTNNNKKWDLAVVDLFLQQGNGLAVLEACRNRDVKQKMVVLTNYATRDIRRRCLELGADAVFDKSTELDEFTQFTLQGVERAIGPTKW
jgi:two-component system, OmpR family, response regulator